MINKYLYALQEDESLNEFIVLPVAVLVAKLYKKYAQYKTIARHCTGKFGIERKRCFLLYKIAGLEKTKKEVLAFKATCEKWSTNKEKCLRNVEKQVAKLDKEIVALKQKLKSLKSSKPELVKTKVKEKIKQARNYGTN